MGLLDVAVLVVIASVAVDVGAWAAAWTLHRLADALEARQG
jgi:hypothetical protein